MPKENGIDVNGIVRSTLLGKDGAYELGRQTAIDEIRKGFKAFSLFEVQTAFSPSWAKGYLEVWKTKARMEETLSV